MIKFYSVVIVDVIIFQTPELCIKMSMSLTTSSNHVYRSLKNCS